MNVQNCQKEGCDGIASGHLIITENQKKLNVCSVCYCHINDVPCEKNNCGDQAVERAESGEFVCQDHKDRMTE